jgi:hypothetical protein
VGSKGGTVYGFDGAQTFASTDVKRGGSRERQDWREFSAFMRLPVYQWDTEILSNFRKYHFKSTTDGLSDAITCTYISNSDDCSQRAEFNLTFSLVLANILHTFLLVLDYHQRRTKADIKHIW